MMSPTTLGLTLESYSFTQEELLDMAVDLQAYLQHRQMLLVLDNFELVLAAAPLVGALLTTCARPKILVTSRTTLYLYGEHEFPVPPLALPEPNQLAALEKEANKLGVKYPFGAEVCCQERKSKLVRRGRI